ncbi:MAG: hypothetical protein HOB84_00505 [Candidatus Marinimicrobia bacterium]|jgi:hypothetical protein|nr:hypothetical protein [Candidatus Neomarinimicrobiota bacterium]MBT5268229.1 hypothetical protein [Candidatus Neomarinimicrobiota bacterium]MBT5467849.1 hypothetical protein [Candidatus Neomarinimicrobiota bacterium]MBT6011870.1 hypothetical protein [Candidatus Neomarinimicrobiota bacterium]
MGPRTKELISTLDELIMILKVDNNTHWAKWMQTAQSSLLESDYYGIEKLLSAYGGMGSFNDVSLSRITRKNESFSKLQTKAYELATEISRIKEIEK